MILGSNLKGHRTSQASVYGLNISAALGVRDRESRK